MWRAQRTSFNTLDNWGHKTPTQSKKDKGQERKVKGSWPETCIQYTWLHILYIYIERERETESERQTERDGEMPVKVLTASSPRDEKDKIKDIVLIRKYAWKTEKGEAFFSLFFFTVHGISCPCCKIQRGV